MLTRENRGPAGPSCCRGEAARRKQCLLLASLLAAALLAPARADEEPEGAGERAPQPPFDPREAVAKVVSYQVRCVVCGVWGRGL